MRPPQLVIMLLALAAAPAQARFDITLHPLSSLTSEQMNAFVAAEQTWELVITGYIDDNNTALTDFYGPTIDIAIEPVDGEQGRIGEAQITQQATLGVAGNPYRYARRGRMQFDSADIDSFSDTTLQRIILHEMGHLLGFGLLWSANNGRNPEGMNLYRNGSGQYTGPAALAAYQVEFDPLATFIPVELDNGPGTANLHWNETRDFLSEAESAGTNPETHAADLLATPMVQDPRSPFFGFSLNDELMSGALSLPLFISNTTRGALVDLGYQVRYAAPIHTAIPEPATGSMLVLLGLAGGGAWRWWLGSAS